jgi:hypothetical protein
MLAVSLKATSKKPFGISAAEVLVAPPFIPFTIVLLLSTPFLLAFETSAKQS